MRRFPDNMVDTNFIPVISAVHSFRLYVTGWQVPNNAMP